MARGAAWSFAILASALGLGVLGYHYFGGLGWLDALLNAAMLLGGEGPVDHMSTTAGKLFASFYALFGGLVFVSAAGVLLAPGISRFLHAFHLEAMQPEPLGPPPGEAPVTSARPAVAPPRQQADG